MQSSCMTYISVYMEIMLIGFTSTVEELYEGTVKLSIDLLASQLLV